VLFAVPLEDARPLLAQELNHAVLEAAGPHRHRTASVVAVLGLDEEPV